MHDLPKFAHRITDFYQNLPHFGNKRRKIFFVFKLTLLEIEIVKNELRPQKIDFFDFPDFFPVEFFHLMKGRLRMQSFKIMGHKTWLRRLPIAFMILQ